MNVREWKMQMYERARRWLTNHARDCVPTNEPRRWSNVELRRLAPMFTGDVLNVSGWHDEDKQGGHYRDYFTNAASYHVTNYRGTDSHDDGMGDSVFLDLEASLQDDMCGICDLAWTHTVLEHVGEVETAFRNLGHLTRDLVMVVVPWIQDEHYSADLYGDYWRFTPMGIQRLMKKADLELLYVNANDQPWYPVYLIAIGSRRPDDWKDRFQPLDWNNRLSREIYNYSGCIS